MKRLPTELLQKVSEPLSDRDILNLPPHIIARTLTDAQAQRLLQRFDVWLERCSLERLNGIGRDPNLAKHVKQLRFHSARLDDISTEANHKSYWLTNHSHMPCDVLNDLHNLSFSNNTELILKQPHNNCSAEECFAKYRKQLEDQKRMEEQGEDFLLLETTFRNLLNLINVSVDNMNRFGLLDVLGNACCHGVIQKPVENSGSHLMELLFRVTSMSTRNLTSFEILRDARTFTYGCGTNTMSFPVMFRKLSPKNISSTVQNLRSLKSKNVYYRDDEIVYHDAVRKASCGYRWTFMAEKDSEHGTTEAIAEMLSSAPLLEDLTLKFYRGSTGYHEPLLTPYMPLHSMKGSNKLQRLKTLSLAKFKTRQDQLVPFLLGAASTMVHIHFDGIVLESGSWLSLFLQLRGKLPQLVRFSVGLDDLSEAKLGAKGMGTEDHEFIAKANDVRVYTIHHSSLFDFDFGNDFFLRWLRDGTGSDIILPALQRFGSSNESEE